jgi:hypothetical protein
MKNKKPVPNEQVLLGHFNLDVEKTDIIIHLAPLPRAPIGQLKAGSPADAKFTGDVKGIGRFELSNLREVDGMATVTVLTPAIPEDYQLVIRAVSRRRPGEYVPTSGDGMPAVKGTDGQTRDLAFQAKLADISAISAEVRDYSTRVEFHNVSLKPGVHTDFHITVNDPPHAAQNAPAGGEQGL